MLNIMRLLAVLFAYFFRFLRSYGYGYGHTEISDADELHVIPLLQCITEWTGMKWNDGVRRKEGRGEEEVREERKR